MTLHIPHTYFCFRFNGALIAYIAVNVALCAAHILCLSVWRNKSGRARALALSILPSRVFLCSGAMPANIPLLACATIFTPCLLIGRKNAN